MVENKFYVIPTLKSIEDKLSVDPDAILDDRESKCPPHPYVFHEMLYYVIVTLTTTGYGDIYPMTNYGMVLFVSVILVALFVITQ